MTKPCDACQSGSAVIYCRADTAFLCSRCDVKVHGANKLASRHERVVMCEVCEHAPAVVTCKADAAALCVNCDNDIHSANPLARRHERVAVVPFYESAPSSVGLKFGHQSEDEEQQCSLLLKDEEEEESSAAEAASWLLPHPNNVNVKVSSEDEVDDVKGGGSSDDSTEATNFSNVTVTVVENTSNTNSSANAISNSNTTASFLTSSKLGGGGAVKEKLTKSQQNFDLFSDVDPYLDMDFVSALGALHPVTDSLVPIHGTEVLGDSSPVQSNASDSYDYKGGHNFCAELSLSTSSIDVGVVPDASLSDISTPQSRPTSIFDLHHHHHHQQQQQQQQQQRPATLHHATPLEPMAREARVLRYREKRKNRKFEKTIRYASRKAYAETRPRIKGRFAKRSEIDVEQMYAVVPDSAFGVVPSY